MLQKYFDIGKLMKGVNLSTLMLSAILSKEQRMLLMFQRRQVIEDRASNEISSNDVGSDEDIVGSFHR